MKVIPEQVQQRTVEQNSAVLVPPAMKELVQERISECIVCRISEGTTTAVKLTPKEQVQQRTVEQTVDDAQVQHNHKVVHVPAVMQRAVPTAQTVQKIVEVPQLQVLDKVVDRPVVVQRHVSTV